MRWLSKVHSHIARDFLPVPIELTVALSPAAAHEQTRVLFHRFIPSSSASVSPFQSRDTILPPPELAPKSDLTPEVVDEHIQGAFEIAAFLRKNVVQGVRTDEGNFGASDSPLSHAQRRRL